MSRTRTLITVLIPAALAGGLFAAPASRADDDDDAAAEARAQVKEARKQAKEQLKAAREQIENAPIPDKLRDKLLAKLDKISKTIDAKLKDVQSADFSDLDALGDQMDAMGEQIEAEMEQMGAEWEQWGEEFQQGFKDKWGNGSVILIPDVPDMPDMPDPPDPPDFDPDIVVVPPVAPTPPTPPSSWSGGATTGVPGGIDIDLGDLDISIDIGDLDLASDQVDALGEIFDDQQDVIEPAQEALDDLADDLRDALANPDATESEIGTLVDSLSAQEAKIRKAQILAWVKSRKLLDADQRTKVEHAKVKRAKRAKHH